MINKYQNPFQINKKVKIPNNKQKLRRVSPLGHGKPSHVEKLRRGM